jgi:hypothetical protein
MTERLATRKPLHEGEKPEEQMLCANEGRNERNVTMILIALLSILPSQ